MKGITPIHSLEDLYNHHGMRLLDEVFKWQTHGVRTDQRLCMEKELLHRRALDHNTELWNSLFPTVDWTSPKQCAELLYGPLGIPPRYNRKKKADGTINQSLTTDSDALDSIIYLDVPNKVTNPDCPEVVKLLYDLRNSKMRLQILERVGPDGYAHPKTLVHRSESGRLVQAEPSLYNITDDDRDIFLPDCPEHDWLHVDYSQVELWMEAWYSKCRRLLEIKEQGDYIHGIVYQDLFKRPFFREGCPPHKRYRRSDIVATDLLKAKYFPHGVSNGLGHKTLAEKYGWTLDEARKYLDRYLEDKPEIKQFHHWIETEVSRTGVLYTNYHRTRRFSFAERNEALAFHPQSTALDLLISHALLPLPSVLERFTCTCTPPHPARVMLGVHDSVEVSSPKRYRAEVARTVVAYMQAPIPEMDGFWIPAEPSFGPNWRDQEPLEIGD